MGIFLVFIVAANVRGSEEIDGLRQVVVQGPVQMTVEVSDSEITVAQPFSVRIEVDAPGSYSVTLPLAESDPSALPNLGEFSILAMNFANRIPIDDDDQRRRWVSELTLETFQVGRLEIPPLESIIRILGGESQDALAEQPIRSKPILVEIKSVLQEGETPASFRDIKDVEEIPVAEKSSWRYWPVISVCLTIVAVFFFRRPKTSPSRLANLEIDQIESAWNEKSLTISQAYDGLSITLRRYFDSRFDIPASSMSANEIADSLSDLEAPEPTIEAVRHFFGEADQLKFSGRTTLDTSHDKTPFDAVRKIIRDSDDSPIGSHG